MSRIGNILARLGGALHADSWANYLKGFGTDRDSTEASRFQIDRRIPDHELSALYHHDDIASRIVDMIPREMLRQGFGVQCSTPERAQTIQKKIKSLDVIKNVQLAQTWARLFGGSVILIGASDGQDPLDALNINLITSFDFLQVYDRRDVTVQCKYDNLESPKFGSPKRYWLTNPISGMRSTVHESRVIRFNGAITGERERQHFDGWDMSVLQRAYPAIRQFQTCHKAMEILMTEASVGVFSIDGLLDMIAGGQLQDLQTRATFMDQCKSVSRSIMLDSRRGETYTKIATSFAGIGEMLDRSANRLSASAEIPTTRLMGQSPAGLNATGASDIRDWYDRVQGDREIELRPPLEFLLRLISISLGYHDEFPTIEFLPLWQETPAEKATREKTEADTAKVWIDGEVLTPEDVAIARFGGDKPQPYKIDPESRRPDLSIPAEEIPGSTGGESTAPVQDLSKTALNGAQIASALEIAKSVVRGELPRDAAVVMLSEFFDMSTETADRLLASIGKGFVPAKVES